MLHADLSSSVGQGRHVGAWSLYPQTSWEVRHDACKNAEAALEEFINLEAPSLSSGSAKY